MSMDNTTPIKVIKQHDKFLARLVDAGIYASKSEANRAGILLLMEKYPQFADVMQYKPVDTTETSD